MITTIYTSYVDDQHLLYIIGDHGSSFYRGFSQSSPSGFVNGHHHLAGRRGLLCCVGGQLTNMQPIRTRKLANFVKTDDDDNDHYGEDHDDIWCNKSKMTVTV